MVVVVVVAVVVVVDMSGAVVQWMDASKVHVWINEASGQKSPPRIGRGRAVPVFVLSK